MTDDGKAVWIIGEPLEVYSDRDAALAMLSKVLETEITYMKGADGWAVAKAIECGQVEIALDLWNRLAKPDRPRIRFEEHEVRG